MPPVDWHEPDRVHGDAARFCGVGPVLCKPRVELLCSGQGKATALYTACLRGTARLGLGGEHKCKITFVKSICACLSLQIMQDQVVDYAARKKQVGFRLGKARERGFALPGRQRIDGQQRSQPSLGCLFDNDDL